MEHIKKYKSVLLIIGIFIFSVLFVITLSSKKNSPTGDVAGSGSVFDQQIIALENKVESNPKNIKGFVDLSNAYLQKVRETGDALYYEKIDSLMEKAEKINSNDADISATKAQVALGRHQFLKAKNFAELAIKQNPSRESYYGLLGDAYIELGLYEEAIAAYQTMVDIRPGFNSYSRIAYIRELYGDVDGAKKTLEQAITSGTSFPENIAWGYVELGKLSLGTNTEEAEKNFNQALQILPDYTPALEGLGKVALAEGNKDVAITYFNNAFDTLSLAQYAISLAETYQVLENETKRNQYVTLAQIAFAKSRESGVDTRLEESLFLADFDTELEKSLTYAKESYEERKSVFGADALSWAYYKNGNYAEAERYGKEALRLGEFSSQILYHQGMIAVKNGKEDVAKNYFTKAYNLNPNFSIMYSKELKKLLQK